MKLFSIATLIVACGMGVLIGSAGTGGQNVPPRGSNGAGAGDVRSVPDSGWYRVTCVDGTHLTADRNGTPACVDNDGKPPRLVATTVWIPALPKDWEKELQGVQTQGCRPPQVGESLLLCIGGVAHTGKPGEAWVCDKGYEPDGLEVTWPNGVFTPKPARCKAKETP